MLQFCGQEQCKLDANGRLKLSSAVLRDFQRLSDRDLVLFCLPEGALGLYPPATWASMRKQDADPAPAAGQSMLARRSLRRFGAFSQRVELTQQGRITIPQGFREHADLEPQKPLMLVGAEIGAEIWSVPRWQTELELIQSHMVRKGEEEMNADLKMETEQ